MGFMLVEIPLIQRLTLYLGSPAYALIVVLFAILLSSGMGSLTTQRVPAQQTTARLQWVILALVSILALQIIFLGALLRWTQQWALVARLAVCIAVIAPTGFLMGQPFPLGIKWVHNHQPESIPWLWAINGAASVVGSSLATIIALQTGFRSASLLGVVCYALTFLVCTLIWRKQTRPAELAGQLRARGRGARIQTTIDPSP